MATATRFLIVLTALSLGGLAGAAGYAGNLPTPQALSQIVPGHSTKAELRALLGAPWRIVQFDDCGQATPGQADETWEYRGTSPDGSYRLHVEFNERGIVHLIAVIPDNAGARGAVAIEVPDSALCLTM
jgi:hypothetical protein